MDSPSLRRKSYQRCFAWTFVISAMLALALLAVEIALPPGPLPRYVPSTSVGQRCDSIHIAAGRLGVANHRAASGATFLRQCLAIRTSMAPLDRSARHCWGVVLAVWSRVRLIQGKGSPLAVRPNPSIRWATS